MEVMLLEKGALRQQAETTTCCMLGEKAERNERPGMNSSSKERKVSERALFEKKLSYASPLEGLF